MGVGAGAAAGAAVAAEGAAAAGTAAAAAGTAAAATTAAAASASWLTYASIASTVIGGLTSVMGSMQQGQAQADSLRYQAQVSANNQLIANQLADQAGKSGEAQVAQKRMQTAGVIGTQLATQSASGLDVNKGSAVDVRSSAAEMGELDALTIRNNAEKIAFGYRSQGLNYGAQAQVDKMGAQNALTAGNLNSFTSLAGSSASVADKWLKFQNAGLLS